MPWRTFSALDPCELNRITAELLADRVDIVTRRTLLARGGTPGAIHHAIRSGRLHVAHPGVYVRGRPQLGADGLAWVAIAACGPGTLAGDHTAAARYGMIEPVAEPPAVTTTSGARPPGVAVRRVRQVPPGLILDGLPTLTPHGVLIQLAATRSQAFLARALAEAEILRLVDHERLAEEASAHRRVRPLLELLEGGPRRTRSPLEDEALPILAAAGFPVPERNVRLLDRWTVDFLWRANKVVLEMDSWTYHATRSHYERDARKDADLALAGFTVVRATRTQLRKEPLKLIARLAPLMLPRS